MWKTSSKRWFCWLFWRFLWVEKTLTILGQFVDKPSLFSSWWQICVAGAIKIEFLRILWKFDFSTKCGGKRKFDQVFPQSDGFLSLLLSSHFFCNVLLTFKKVNKINALRRFSTDFSHHFSTPICHCGKIVEIITVFPQFHNLFITWRRDCDKS